MYTLSSILLCVIIYTVHNVKSQSHAFIQVDNELRYLVDGVPIPMREILEVGDSEQRHENIYDETILKNFLIFEPPFLDFKEHPIGMPKMRKVYVQNTSPDTSIHLHSLSGNTMHFHCTFFQDKIIGPGHNTSFDVVYLGREEGFIENTIYIHTSVGTYRYWVKAVGTANPYRIRPLIGLRMPLNSSYTPVIQVHNPHSHNLQIVEMYSTGGDLHLELPEGVQEGEKQHWSIPGHHTKSVMRATFVARRENNHTAYIRIVPGEPVSDFMVIPVEVEVSSEQGLFFPSDSLYFGVLTSHDPPVSLPLFLLNSAHKHIHIQNIITSAVNEAITIDFKPVKIPPGTVHPTQVATVTFNPAKATNGVKVSGKLLIKSKISAYKLSVPFSVDMYQGALVYNSSATTFYSGSLEEDWDEETISSPFSLLGKLDEEVSTTDDFQKPKGPDIHRPHDLTLRNLFKFSVVVYNLSLSTAAASHFKLKWNGPVVIEENQEAVIAKLKILSQKSDLLLTVNMTVHTNITSINIPLVVYNGKLTKYIPSPMVDKWLDFGTLGMGEQRNVFFYILNENPVEIRLKGWGSTVSHSAVELMGIHEGTLPISDTHPPNKTFMSKSMFLKPNHYAVFRIGVLSPNNEGIFVAEAFVQTQFEVITIPFRVRTADGLLSISPSALNLENSFPGKISFQDIHILSTFSHLMTVEGINPLIPDSRFTYVAPNTSQSQPVLLPGLESHIGRIVFDPKAECVDECYSGFTLDSKAGQQWTNTFTQTAHTADTDTSFFNLLLDRYKKLSSFSFNASLSLDTSEVQGHRFNAKVNMVWPRLVPKKKLEFPLTELFNTTVKDFVIENPASQPVAVQLLFLHQYPGSQSIAPLIEEHFHLDSDLSWKNTEEELFPDTFSFFDSDQGNVCNPPDDTPPHPYCFFPQLPDPQLSDELAGHRRRFEANLKSRPSKDSLVLFLQPLEKVKIRVSFMPVEEKAHSTLILIRNNLTAIESLLLKGQSGTGHLTIEKSKYKSNYLQFNIQPSYIKNCSLSSPDYTIFSLLKSIVVKNDGSLPTHIVDFKIGDTSCRGFGFAIVNCSGFTLQPNEHKKIELSFTPDFSLFYLTQTLTIETSLTRLFSNKNIESNLTLGNNLNIKIVGTVASSIVNTCGTTIPRPSWEPLVYYSCITILLAMLVGTLIRAFLEAEHTLRTTFVPMTTVLPANQSMPQFDKSKVFDLQTSTTWDPEEYLADNDVSATSYAKEEVCSHNINNNNSPTVKVNSRTSPIEHAKKSTIPNSYYDKPKIVKLYNSKGHSCNSDKTEDNLHNCARKSKSLNNKYNKNIALSLSSLFPAGFGLKDSNKKSKVTPERLSQPKDDLPNEEGNSTETEESESKRATSISENSSTTESSSIDDICPVKEQLFITAAATTDKVGRRQKKNLERNFSEDCILIKANSICYEKTGFEITAKSKRLKKLKENNKKVNLELPYTLKHNRIRDSSNEPIYKTSSRIRNKVPSHTDKMVSSPTLQKQVTQILFPNQELPKVLAKAVVAPRVHPQNQPLAPRDPSYSAVVLGNTKPKTKATPVGKILPEVKHVERPLGLGVIGQKKSTHTGGPMHSLRHPVAVSHLQVPPPSLPMQDPSSYNLYMRNMNCPGHVTHTPGHVTHTPGHVTHTPGHMGLQQPITNHAWEPKPYNSPPHLQALQELPGLPYDSMRSSAMADDDWLSFEGANYSYHWTDGDNCQPREKPLPAAPSPSLWESLSSFSIWSSPYESSLLPMSPSYSGGISSSLWQDERSNPSCIGSDTLESQDSLRAKFESINFNSRHEGNN